MSKLWLAIPFLPLAPVVIGLSIITARAEQEKPARTTRTWVAVQTPRSVHVEVVDTEGVCLYVATRYVYGGAAVAITAVPKTQLPAGIGCQ